MDCAIFHYPAGCVVSSKSALAQWDRVPRLRAFRCAKWRFAASDAFGVSRWFSAARIWTAAALRRFGERALKAPEDWRTPKRFAPGTLSRIFAAASKTRLVKALE
jgi:hypothetical protein